MIGETKFVELEIISRDNADFLIPSATWELESMGEVIEQGTAIVDGHNISVLLTAPESVGQYELTVWYSIPPEVIAAKVIINVCD